MQALGVLAEAIKRAGRPKQPFQPPKNVPNGEFNKWFMKAAQSSTDETSFWQNVESIPGFRDKADREVQAASVWRNWIGKRGNFE